MHHPYPTSRRFFLRHSLNLGAASLIAPYLAPNLASAEPPAPGATWQIGCFTRPWDQFDYRVALDDIAEAGFRYAGLMTTKGGLVISVATKPEDVRHIAAEAQQRALKIICVYGGDFPVHESLAAGIAGLRTLIDHAATVGSPFLMVGGTGDDKLVGPYYKTVAECCDYAAEKHVGIVLKPHGGLNATGPQCRQTIKQVGHKSFSLWYDPGNIYYYSDGKLDPVTDAPSVAGLVTGVCIKDFTISQQNGQINKDVLLAPGTGKVDFRAVMGALKKGGFHAGPLVIETLARGDRPSLLTQAKRARAFTESLTS